MPTEETIEQRLVAVETAIAELRRHIASESKQANWVKRFSGAFKDEPAFAKVVEYGRAIRAVDRPPEDHAS